MGTGHLQLRHVLGEELGDVVEIRYAWHHIERLAAAMALAMTGITLDLDALLIEGDANRSDDDA